MNFLSRNLGWIMLFLFFLFMLFVISTNQKKEGVISESGSVTVLSGSKTDDTESKLDNLVDKIVDENQGKKDEDVKKKAAQSQTGTTDKKEEKGSIFDFFKKEKSEDEESYNKGQQVKKTDKEVSLDGENVEEGKKQEDNFINEKQGVNLEKKSSVVTVSPGVNLVKNTPKGSSVESQLPFSTPSSLELPGVDLETEVGKFYQVGVHSLKLNNAYFNQTLAYMMKGDVVKQLTKENNRGCFQVKITNSVYAYNNGLVGYVCKKYLSDITSQAINNVEVQEESIVAKEEVKVIIPTNEESLVQPDNKASAYYSPNTNMFLTDKNFSQKMAAMDDSEVLKKIGEEDKNGCFQVRIVGSSSDHCENVGLEGYVCRDFVSPYTK